LSAFDPAGLETKVTIACIESCPKTDNGPVAAEYVATDSRIRELPPIELKAVGETRRGSSEGGGGGGKGGTNARKPKKCLQEKLPKDIANVLAQSPALENKVLSSFEEAYDLGLSNDVATYVSNVSSQGQWDFKSPSFDTQYAPVSRTQRETVGNFAFGASASFWLAASTGGASWLAPAVRTDVLQRGAGAYQAAFGPYDAKNGNPLDSPGASTYGDEPADFANVARGSDYAQDAQNCVGTP
jgi:hypothetical protein